MHIETLVYILGWKLHSNKGFFYKVIVQFLSCSGQDQQNFLELWKANSRLFYEPYEELIISLPSYYGNSYYIHI